VKQAAARGPHAVTDRPKTDNKDIKSGWLNDARSRVVAAIITALAGASGGFYAGLQAGSPSSPQFSWPSISLTTPNQNSRIGASVTVSGVARNLHPHQMMWVFVQFIHPDGTPSGNIYPVLGPCPIDESGIWTCSNVKVGDPGDYGKQYKIWAAIVTDQQAYTYASLMTSLHSRRWFSPAGDGAPPHASGRPGVAETTVTRCTDRQQCAAG
jgi:hypothetical protein